MLICVNNLVITQYLSDTLWNTLATFLISFNYNFLFRSTTMDPCLSSVHLPRFLRLGGENHHDSAPGHEAASALHHTQQQDRDFIIGCQRCLHLLRRLLRHPSAPSLHTLVLHRCRLALLLLTAHTHAYVGGLGKHEHRVAAVNCEFYILFVSF